MVIEKVTFAHDEWEIIPLGELITTSKEKIEPTKIDIPLLYIGLEHIEKNTGKLNGWDDSNVVKSTKTVFHKGDVLYGRLRPYLNKVYLAEFNGICSTDILVFQTLDGRIFNKYLFYRLLSPDFVNFTLQLMGGYKPRVNFKKISTFQVSLPDIETQKEIVEKIEKIFSQLESGINTLIKTQHQLLQYRQAVFTAAFMGNLTKMWRELKNTEIKSATTLMTEIYEQRGETWEQESSTEIMDQFSLPESWLWVSINQLGEVHNGITKNQKLRANNPIEIPYLRVANVYANKLKLDNMKTIMVKENEIQRYSLEKEDLLIVEGNGSRSQIGRVALWDGSISPCIHQNHVIAIRFRPTNIAKYVLFWLLSRGGRRQIEELAATTSGLYTFSVSKVGKLRIPLPPLEEQNEIIDAIETNLTVVNKIRKIIKTQLVKADSLRNSILKYAFEGKMI